MNLKKIADDKSDLISVIRESMAECGKYNDKQMESWYNKLIKLPNDKLKSIITDPHKYGLKCQIYITDKVQKLLNLEKIAEEIRKVVSISIYEDSEWLIKEMTGIEDCHYFKQTRMDLQTPRYMEEYLKIGGLYFIRNKITNEVYGYSPKLKIFQNRDDRAVNIEKFLSEIENDDFIRAFKQLKEENKTAQVHAPEKKPVTRPLRTPVKTKPTPEDDPFKSPRPRVIPKPKNTYIGEIK
jgi:hypothetical protein